MAVKMNPRILVVGSGGREHAIILKLAQSKYAPELFACPGNAGIARHAKCLPISATDVQGVVNAALENEIDIVFVAPDDPLMLGMVNALEDAGIRAFGPRSEAAIIEGSKVFAKDLMKKYSIPTAAYEVFSNYDDAYAYIMKQNKFPCVIKANGLALGKGVIIAKDAKEAEEGLRSIMQDKVFGASGDEVVIEEFLQGPEVSVLAFTDGKTIVPMVSAQDHKRAFDNDEGKNTGGMGTFSPSLVYTKELEKLCYDTIFVPTMNAMNAEGRTFCGVIYFGLMICKDGPKVIEYNARFGDPETQVVLPRLKTDFIDIIDATIDARLDKINIEWDDNTALCVIAASGGYPDSYKKGYKITGIDEAEKMGATVFCAGVAKEADDLVTNGGRVLGVGVLGKDMESARASAYEIIKHIEFKDMFYRKDIGIKK